MPYSTVSLVWQNAPAINSVTALTSAVVFGYIKSVEAEIDSKISKRYALPLASGSYPVLEALATREAIYRIMVQRALIQFPPAQQGRHPLYQQHIDDQKLLDQIADGQAQIVNSSGEVVGADLGTMEIFSTTMDHIPTFHEGDPLDMIQDQEKLDDIKGDRGL